MSNFVTLEFTMQNPSTFLVVKTMKSQSHAEWSPLRTKGPGVCIHWNSRVLCWVPLSGCTTFLGLLLYSAQKTWASEALDKDALGTVMCLLATWSRWSTWELWGMRAPTVYTPPPEPSLWPHLLFLVGHKGISAFIHLKNIYLFMLGTWQVWCKK